MTARGRRFAVLLALAIGVATPLAVAAAPSSAPPQQYVVRSGDTISSIALRLQVAGGWEALHAANTAVLGTDPHRLAVGQTLVVPTRVAAPAPPLVPGSYIVRSGDTLSVVAARLDVPGGRDALYAANRATIGPDPNRLSVGMALRPPPSVQPVPAAPVAAQPPAAQAPVAQAPVAQPPAAQAPAAQAPAAQAPAVVPAPAAAPAAGEIPAAPVEVAPLTTEADNDVLVAALLGSAFLLLVALFVYGVLPLRDPDRSVKDQLVVTPPSSLEPFGDEAAVDGAEPVGHSGELHLLELMMPAQREPEVPLEIRLDPPDERPARPSKLSKSSKLSA